MIAELEAPEVLAQRAEAQSKLQSAQAQLALRVRKSTPMSSTYERLKAASPHRCRRRQ
jgi:hypothetical protein